MKHPKLQEYHKRTIQPSAKEKLRQVYMEQNPFIGKLKAMFDQRGEVTVENLHEHLRVAMMLELSTIPPYFGAMFSIIEGDHTRDDYQEVFGDNREASYIIRSVMMEEMLHFTLAGNVLNACGGKPMINHREFVPEYPTAMPDSAGLFEIHLSKFTRDQVRTFMRIEQPTPPDAEPALDGYETIGQFYNGIKELINQLEDKGVNLWTGDKSLQIDANYYYGGGGKVIRVKNKKTAFKAINLILEQGEGSETSIYDEPVASGHDIRELAHFYKFNEIYEERRYADCQNDPKQPPNGPELVIKYDQVYNMAMDPKTADYVDSPDLVQLSNEFNLEYRKLLDDLQAAFTGEKTRLIKAVGDMYKLRYKALELMRNPIPGRNVNAGPTWEFLSDLEVTSLTENA